MILTAHCTHVAGNTVPPNKHARSHSVCQHLQYLVRLRCHVPGTDPG